jgi:hypothetical protein
MKQVTFAFVIVLALVVAMTGPIAAAPAYWESSFGTGLNQGDDDSDYVPFGFTFYFYGVPYSGAWINSNGNMTFNDPNPSGMSPDVPEGSYSIIAPLYGDFNPAWDGDVYYNTLGEPGSRRFVVTWHVVPEYFADGSNTFQAALYEDTNLIQFGYNGLTTDGTNWNTLPMAVGISSGTGNWIRSASGSAIPALDNANIFYRWTGTDYVESMTFPVVNVDIDIKPQSDSNSINLKSKGVIPVAILGSASFDVTDVDITSLAFGPLGAAPAHDLTDPDVYAEHLQDVNGDTYTDLVSHYRTQATGITAGDTAAELTFVADGISYSASDSIRTVPTQ